VAEADYGPGYELGKHGDIEPAVYQAALGPYLASIHIYQIGDGLEGKKRDTCWQMKGGQNRGAQQGCWNGGEKDGVFAKDQWQ